MYFRLNELKQIIDCSEERYADDCLFTTDKIDRGFDGALMFVSDMQTEEYKKRKQEKEQKDKVEKLRFDRENECFVIINRGQLWYETLTLEQKEELKLWYKSWLDVTKTFKKPTKPNFV